MAALIKDVNLDSVKAKPLTLKIHSDYIAAYGENKEEYEYCMTEYLRMSGIYWGLTAMALMADLDRMKKEEILEFVRSCQDPVSGGISSSPGHDPHLLYTLSALQILSIYDEKLSDQEADKVVGYIKSLQQPSGSFVGDKWGEEDTRFSFCAVASLSLIGRLHEIDLEKATNFVASCMNFDGGFGSRPGSESHAGLIYCCVGYFSVVGRLDLVDADTLGWWLCERQLPSGGLNGRPEKLPDVCYSWWVLASLCMLGRLHWVDKEKLCTFISACQDSEGGFADRPGNMPDPFHTLFGLAALSLLGEPTLEVVDPTFCMPRKVIDRLGLNPQRLTVS